MSTIQFSHANGFPAACYQVLFEQLKPHDIQAVPVLGQGKYYPKKSWRSMAYELIENIENKDTTPVWGVGHSLGGVITLWASVLRPDLFQEWLVIHGRKTRGWNTFR